MKRLLALVVALCMFVSLGAGIVPARAVEATQPKVYFDLDFEDAADVDAFTQRSYFTYADGQTIDVVEDGADHAVKLSNGSSYAFMQSLVPEETVNDFEVSFKYKFTDGTATEGTSVWVYDSGNEDGYQILLLEEKMELRAPGGGEDVLIDATMESGYRNTEHTYTVKSVGSVLTVSMDGAEVLKYEEIGTKASNGITFSGWSHEVYLDDILWQEVVAENSGDDNTGDDNTGDDNTGDDNTGNESQEGVYFDLDFEGAEDINKLTKRSYSTYADGQSVTTAESGDNHYAHIGLNGGMAYMVSLVPEETAGNFEMSVKMREIGSSSSSTSIWLFDSGAEDGYRFLFEDNRIDMRLPGAGEATVSANMDAGYRTEDHVYTFKVVGSVLTLSVDGEEVLKYENATARPANGITFGGWSHDLALDDILWKEVTAEDSGDDNTGDDNTGDSTETKVYFDLDFEDAEDINKLTKRSYSSYADGQSVTTAESGENHYAHIGLNGGMAYMVSLVPEETVGDFEMSVKMREIGSSSSSTSIWLFDSGNEDGYRFFFEDDRIDLKAPGSGSVNATKSMTTGYRQDFHIFTFKVVGSVITLSMDGEELLKYEDATTRPANGITFGGWSHDLALDDILWKEATAEDSGEDDTDDDIIYEDISLEEFLSQIPEDSLAHDVLNNCLYEIDLGKWYTDVNEAAGHYGASHLQGFCCDDKGEYFYASFTNILVKTDMKTGEIVGVVKGMATGSITGGAHIGDLCYYDGTVYGSLEYKTAERFYICAFDVEKIDGVVNYNDPGVMYGMYIPQVGDDFVDNLNAGEHNNEESSMGHRYGTSGIDGITFGTLPGKGYDTDGDGDVDVSTGDERFMIVAQCAYQNAQRYDNENLILLVFDVDDITADNMLPFTEELLNQEYTDAQKLLYKHKVFVYTGNQEYGVQQLEFDEETGDLLLECYGSADGSEFPKGSRFVIDGSVPLYMDTVEVGQSVTGNASGFVTQAAAHTTAALYTDYQDGDGDDNTSEQETGWHATLKCICGENKKLDTNHPAKVYGETGHACQICVDDAQFTEGLRSLGNDLFYGATSGGNSNYQYGSASLYWLNRYTYSYEKITPPAVDAFGTVLDFEDANDINAFVKQSYSGFAGQQGVSITTDGENHVAYLRNSGTSVNANDGEAAYMVTLNSENATDDFKVSFKYKFADGDTGEGTSVWVYDSGEENGYQVLFLNNSIELRAPGGVEEKLTSAAMQSGYRSQYHTYTITSVGNVLTVSVDDKTVLKYEEIGTKASDGITFSGWFHEIYLDDIHWQEATEADIGEVEIHDDDNTGDSTEAKVYFDLDFEDAADVDAFTQRSYFTYADGQTIDVVEDGADHAVKLSNGSSYAFMQSLVPEETVSDFEVSFKYKFTDGTATEGTSVWAYDSGNEDGYQILLLEEKMELRAPGGGEDVLIDATMESGYRNTEHTYTVKSVGSVLTVSMDGTEVLKYEEIGTKASNGITFSGWNHEIYLDDILWEAIPAEVAKEIYLDLDFEDATHKDAFSKNDFSGYASDQIVEIVEDGEENHVLEVGATTLGWDASQKGSNAYMIYNIPTEQVEDFELSFKYKFVSGNKAEGTSVWVRNNGSENGYAFRLTENMIILEQYQNNQYQNATQLGVVSMPEGYRDSWKTYTVTCEGTVLTLQVDGDTVITYEQADYYGERGICFTGWYHFIHLDDVLMTNLAPGANQVYTPEADVPSGDVMEGTAVSLTCKTEGATIFYTVDGTAPTAESTQYTAPIVITADTTLKAIAIKEGMDNSRVLTRTYKMLDLGGMLSKEIMYLSVGDVSAISDLFENTETQAEMTAKFTSSDESVVTVDERGFVEAKATGTAKITASVEIEGTDIAIGECTVVVNSVCSMFYYIAPNGSDSNPGTIDAPFATLEHARDVIRGISLPEGGVTIYFREGEYYLDDKVVFGTQDSGEPGKPIVYASYPGEDAMIHSGRKLEGWTLLQEEDYPAGLPNAAKGNTYVLDIETGWRFHDLYVNGERQQVARQINSSDYHDWEGFDTTPTLPTRQTDAHEKGMFIKFNDGDLKDVPGNGDVEVYLLTAVWWNCLPVVKDVNEADDTARLHSYMPSILPEWDHCFQIEDDEIGRYNLMNAPKFLDEAGEWCVDSQNGKVYFWPKNADDLNKTVAPVADELIRLEGDGEAQNWANQVEFIEFRDLEFAYVDRRGEDELIDENEAEPILLRNSENPYSAIFMRGTSNIAIVDCVIRHAGAYAVSMHNYSQYNRVVGTLMEDLGAGGVEIYGYGAGFVDNNGHHTIIGNNISDIGLAPYEHSSAVTMFGTSYNDVKLNKISNVPYTAIMMAGTEANLMNPNKKNDPIIICDCYGNQGAGNNVRWAEMDQVPEAYHFEWQLRGEDASMPYQHLDYNTCTYNSAFEYMMRLSDGGCYYGFYTGRNNEYSYNTAYKSGYSSAGGMCWPLYADNAFRNSIWIGNAVCAPQTGFMQTAENMVWKDNVSESYGTDYHDQLENTIANLTAEYLGGWLTKSETLPVITVAPRATENLINAIGTVTLDSKDAIEAARAAYDDLTEAQKSMVSNADKLTSAEEKYAEMKEEADQNAVDEAAANAVEELISALDPVTLDSKEAIDATRAAYDALTDAQKQLVSNLSELVEAETKYAELKAADEQAKADEAAAKVVVDLIDAIGTVSLDSKETIEAARTAYDALTDAQKALITNVDALLLAEAKYADLSAVKSVEDKIAAIGDVTLESKANIDAAREAYEALTAGQKEKVTNLDVLSAAEAKYAELKAEADQQEIDKAAAKSVENKISAIGTVFLDSKGAIEDARVAYEALTAVQKTLVTNLKTLTDAEAKYAELKAADDQDKADKAAAKAVTEKIDAIGVVTLNSKEAIEEARTAYNALNATQKALVTNLDKLTDAESKYADLSAAKAVMDKINAIGTVTLESEEAIEEARAAYNALTAAQKELVTNLNVLAAAEEKYAELEEAAPGDVIVKPAPGNANGATFADSQNVAGKIELTDAEKQAIEDGDDLTISLKVRDVSTTVSKDTKDKIAAVAGDYTVGLYLDISMFKQVGDEDPVAITKTNGAVKISIVVPDAMINNDPTVTRSYSIIRVHNGVAQMLPTTFNSSTKTVTFESDSFSDYALAYKDVKKDTPTEPTTGGVNNNTSDTPKTGDTAKLGMWIALMAVAVVGIVMVFIPMLKKRNYKAKY